MFIELGYWKPRGYGQSKGLFTQKNQLWCASQLEQLLHIWVVWHILCCHTQFWVILRKHPFIVLSNFYDCTKTNKLARFDIHGTFLWPLNYKEEIVGAASLHTQLIGNDGEGPINSGLTFPQLVQSATAVAVPRKRKSVSLCSCTLQL
jgi:hypothetical protein